MKSARRRPVSLSCFCCDSSTLIRFSCQPGELGGEAHVLAAAADRDGEVLLVDDDVHRVLLLVDEDALHFGRRQRVDDELAPGPPTTG